MSISDLTIRDICTFVGGSQPPKSQFRYSERAGYVRLVQTRDFKTDAFKTYIPASSTNKFCDENDIMIGRYGPPVFQVFRGIKGAYNVALLKAIPKPGTDNDYLYYFLKQDSIFRYVDGLSHRTGGQTGVDLTSLNDYPVRLPDLPDQVRIGRLLRLLDEKIESNTKASNEIELLARTMFDYWFTQFDYPDTNGNPYKSSGGDMKYSKELDREIPREWSVGTLDDIASIVGGSTPATSEPQNYQNVGTPWITPNDLSDNIGKKYISRGGTDVSEKGIRSASLKIYPKGTVLLTSRAPVGYMAIARNALTTNQGFKSFVPDKGYSTEFIYFVVKNSLQTIIQYSSGSTFKEISGTVLKSITIPIPDRELTLKYTALARSFFEQQDLLEREISYLTDLRDWLIPLLVNSQIRISANSKTAYADL